MKVKSLIKLLKKMPSDADVVLSKHYLIDTQDELEGIIDIPIYGIALSQEKDEVRFVIESDNINEEIIGDFIYTTNGDNK